LPLTGVTIDDRIAQTSNAASRGKREAGHDMESKDVLKTDSPALAIARAHVDAWSNHDFDKARGGLAPDVRVTSTTTQPIMADVHLTGVDAYMEGLIHFAQTVVPGSARKIAGVGDERNALLMLTVEAELGGARVTLPAARLYLLDDNSQITAEQVIFYASPE
jgi:hypothetical protein